MSVNSISYSSIKDQIIKMRAQGLIINDISLAEFVLKTYGYSSVVKSYRDAYVYVDSNGKKLYRDGVTFEQIYSLFTFDQVLRSAVFTCMLDIEAYIKNLSSEIVSKDFGTDPAKYLDFRNYRDKSSNPRFSLNAIIKSFRDALTSNKNPIKYYRDNYGVIPPWILFDGVYFSTIVNFVRDFKPKQQDQIASQMYTLSGNFDLAAAKELMVDTLFICNEFRNLAAHRGRIYNYVNDAHCRRFPNDEGIVLLLRILGALDYKAPYKHLADTLNAEVNRHCSMYPQDATYLGQILKMNIQMHSYVYALNGSKVIHSNPYCSGMKNPVRIEVKDEVLNKYSKCKRCMK